MIRDCVVAYENFKTYIGTAYNGEKKQKSTYVYEPPPIEDGSEPSEVASSDSVQLVKPSEQPEIFYTANPDWVRNLVEDLWLLADERHITKTQVLNLILEREFESDEELLDYMLKNKTDCALKLFNSTSEFNFPEYINNAIN